ncbi:MAG TPA: nuclear transport factor 2 family protein [Solirubrobacterales bacterium]|jgi:ketosteroid isomerase-like protein
MSQENVETVRRLLDAGERDDIPAALACLDPDLEWVALRSATEGAYHGHRGYERFVADTRESFEIFEPRFELRDLSDRVLAWGTIRVRGSGSGVEIDVPVGGIFDFRDERITRWRDYGSKGNALEAARLSDS